MKTTSIITLVAVTAVALGLTLGSTHFLKAGEKRKPWPKATPPEPPSPIYVESTEPALTEAQITALTDTHNRTLALQIEKALLGRDRRDREAAFTFLVPELLQFEPRLLVEMVDAQKPGETRDALCTELARQWISRDRDATIDWIRSLDDPERRAAAYAAVRTIAPESPEQALYVANQFDIGYDDGYLAQLVERWAVDEPRRATDWLATQPDGPRKRLLAPKIENTRRPQGAARS